MKQVTRPKKLLWQVWKNIALAERERIASKISPDWCDEIGEEIRDLPAPKGPADPEAVEDSRQTYVIGYRVKWIGCGEPVYIENHDDGTPFGWEVADAKPDTLLRPDALYLLRRARAWRDHCEQDETKMDHWHFKLIRVLGRMKEES